jgi:hypothetical protein
VRLSYTQHWVLITIVGQWIPHLRFPTGRYAPEKAPHHSKTFCADAEEILPDCKTVEGIAGFKMANIATLYE